MAHGSTSQRKGRSGFRGGSHPNRRGGGAGDWPGYHEAIATFTTRLARVVIEERPALDLIHRGDRADTPPLRPTLPDEHPHGRQFNRERSDAGISARDDGRRPSPTLRRAVPIRRRRRILGTRASYTTWSSTRDGAVRRSRRWPTTASIARNVSGSSQLARLNHRHRSSRAGFSNAQTARPEGRTARSCQEA